MKYIPFLIISSVATVATPCMAADVLVAASTGFECMIQPNQTIEVRSPVVGVLKTAPVKKGSFLRKGDVLATIEASVEQSAVNTAKFRTQLQGSVAAARNKLDSANAKASRMKTLSEERFVSAQAYDDALNERNQAQAELIAAQESLQQARFEYAQSQADLERRIIRSPFNGVVTEQYLYPGSIVSPTDGKYPIFKIAQTDQLIVKAIIPFKFFKQVRVGQTVTIEPEAPFNHYKLPAKLHTVDTVIDAGSGTFGAVTTIMNKNLSFPSGIRCKMLINNL